MFEVGYKKPFLPVNAKGRRLRTSLLTGVLMRNFALVIALTVLFAIAGPAQQSGSLTGTVTDPSGQVVPGAVVKLTSEVNGQERETIANETGDFAFTALVPGAYTIR